MSGGLSASLAPSGGAGARPTGDARPLWPAGAWPWWLAAALVGLTLTGLRLVLGQGRTLGGWMPA